MSDDKVYTPERGRHKERIERTGAQQHRGDTQRAAGCWSRRPSP